jgi:hypothetical protein
MLRQDGTSQTTGIMLMILVTILLAAIIIALLLSMPSLQYSFAPIPAIFTMTLIESTDEITKQLNYDSRVLIMHTGTETYQNNNLKALFFRNGIQLNANIETMNGHDFISTSHTGVQWMGGMGCSGATWIPGEMTRIDLEDRTFRPGDIVRLDIIDKSQDKIISRNFYKI